MKTVFLWMWASKPTLQEDQFDGNLNYADAKSNKI